MIKIDLSLRQILTIAAVVIALWLLVQVWSVVVLAGVALLIATALLPFVEWVRTRTKRRTLSVVIVVFTVLGALALLLAIVVPPMWDQGRDLWEQYPERRESAARFADERGWYGIRDRIQSFDPGAELGPRLVDTGRIVFSVVFALFTTFFLAAYFMLDAGRLKGFLYFSTPRHWHPHIRALLPALQRVVGGYIRGQAITSGAIFVFTFVVLTAMGIPNALALAAIAAVCDLIPLVGAYLVVGIVGLSSLSGSLTATVLVVTALIVYQQFEDRVLIPRVYGQTLRLPTIAVVLAILIGAELLGLVGALLALPVAAGIRVTVEYFDRVRRESATDAAADVAPSSQPFAPDSGDDGGSAQGRAERREAPITP